MYRALSTYKITKRTDGCYYRYSPIPIEKGSQCRIADLSYTKAALPRENRFCTY